MVWLHALGYVCMYSISSLFVVFAYFKLLVIFIFLVFQCLVLQRLIVERRW
jgi:hypothetical protein